MIFEGGKQALITYGNVPIAVLQSMQNKEQWVV